MDQHLIDRATALLYSPEYLHAKDQIMELYLNKSFYG